MDDSEKKVKEYLELEGYKQIVFEPNAKQKNKNNCPDFSIEGKIGVEVTQLNQQFSRSSTKEPLIEKERRASEQFIQVLHEFTMNSLKRSTFVRLKFRRPLKLGKSFKQDIRGTLRDYQNGDWTLQEIPVRDRILLQFIPASEYQGQPFVYGGHTDEDSGGFTQSILQEALETAIIKKEGAIRKVQDDFKEWWLAVVDWGYAGTLFLEAHNLQPIQSLFSKIILINHKDLKRTKQLSFDEEGPIIQT
jgi:hypothetical protein